MKNFVKNNKLIYIAVLLVIALVIGGFALSQAGLLSYNIIDDSKKSDAITVEAPSFSAESGFYDNPFYLELSVPKGTRVYYTLDSSDPDENSIEYTGPIYLDDASKNENVYSMRTDVSAGFRTDLIEKYQTHDSDPQYKVPEEKLDKCNVVRAFSVDKNGNSSEIITKSFFVGLDSSKYQGMNIISIVTDPDNLFDYDKGIYVTGRVFDDYIASGKPNEVWHFWDAEYWHFWGANYRQKGSAWEREANACFVNLTDDIISEHVVGIRIQGGGSRGALPRSLNVFSRKKDDLFPNLYDNEYYPDVLTLSSGGNKLLTKINDVLITDRIPNLNVSTMKFKPCILFLEGEYWGFYWLAERYDENYLSYYYNVDPDNVVMIKNGDIACGKEHQKVLYERMKEDIINSDMNSKEGFDNACKLIDIDSFVDYYAMMAYIARGDDWPRDNYALWRTVESKSDKYSDCKWRWMVFDCNSVSMTENLTEDNTLSKIIQYDSLFAAFWKNEEFRDIFKNRILEIADVCFDGKEMEVYINQYNDSYYPYLKKSWNRFLGNNSEKETEYFDLLESHKSFYINRKVVVESWFK